MDVGRGRVDMVVSHQSLDDGQVDTGLGQRGAERVPQCVRMTRAHARPFAVIAEHCPQPRGRELLPPVRTLRHHEQHAAVGVRPLDQ